jgi:hypothetical protein
MVSAVLAFSILPGSVARSRRTLFVSDIALMVLPPLLFYATGNLLNPELQVGWGFIVYPFLVLVACVGTLYMRVFLFDHVSPNPLRNTVVCLTVASVLATMLGGFIPPLYD